jgi:hypothetical protein
MRRCPHHDNTLLGSVYSALELPPNAVRQVYRCRHFYGPQAASELGTGLAHHGGLAFVEYIDDAEHHWTVIIDGAPYRMAVTPFLPIDGETQVQQVGDWDWKPDQILMRLRGWWVDWREMAATDATTIEPPRPD